MHLLVGKKSILAAIGLISVLQIALLYCRSQTPSIEHLTPPNELSANTPDSASSGVVATKEEPDWLSVSQTARDEMLIGHASKALAVFMHAWNSDQHSGWSRGRLALYIGLCREHSNPNGSNAWLQLAREEGIPELGSDSHSLFAALGSASITGERRNYIQLVSLDAGSASDAELKQLQQAVGQLRSAHEKFDKSSLDSKVRYATWLLLISELTSKWDDLCLSTTSADTYDAGKSLLVQVGAEVDQNPQLQKELDQNSALAIRYDAAQARLNFVDERAETARRRERDRLNQLRSIAKSYRSAIEAIGNADISFLLGDTKVMSDSRRRRLNALVAIDSTLNARKDFYLFSDEPNLLKNGDLDVLKIIPEPYSPNAISFQNAIQGLSYLQLAGVDPKNARNLLDQARHWAGEALKISQRPTDGGVGVADQDLLANYVQVAASDQLGRLEALDPNPTTRNDSSQQFADARAEISKMSGPAAGKLASAGLLPQLITELAARLSDPVTVESNASKLVEIGKAAEAAQELFNGAIRHHSPELAINYLQLRRRNGLTPNVEREELQKFQEAGILPENSPIAQLELNRLKLTELGQKLASKGMPAQSDPEHQRLKSVLADLETQLRLSLKQSTDGPLYSATAIAIGVNTCLFFGH